MRVAMVCNTPYQLMGVLNYTYHLKQTKDACVDLYIGDNFFGFEKVYPKLQESGLFANIYVFHPKRRRKNFFGKIERLLQVLSPKYCMDFFAEERKVYAGKKYDQIVASVASFVVVALIQLFPDAEVYYYDDGVGSYTQELSYSMVSPIVLKINRILGRDIDRISPKKILLNCPEMATPEIKEKAEQMPELAQAPEELVQIFCDLWNYTNDGYYKSHKLIALLSPESDDDSTAGMAIFQNKLPQFVPPVCENYLMRLHPRQKPEEYPGCRLDDHRDMWELVCADQITDEHVLLSHFSTAQMTPKMLYDKEPTLVFAFKAYPEGCSQEKEERFWGMVRRLKASYQNKDKIIVPETPEELWKCVAELCAGKEQEGTKSEE